MQKRLGTRDAGTDTPQKGEKKTRIISSPLPLYLKKPCSRPSEYVITDQTPISPYFFLFLFFFLNSPQPHPTEPPHPTATHIKYRVMIQKKIWDKKGGRTTGDLEGTLTAGVEVGRPRAPRTPLAEVHVVGTPSKGPPEDENCVSTGPLGEGRLGPHGAVSVPVLRPLNGQVGVVSVGKLAPVERSGGLTCVWLILVRRGEKRSGLLCAQSRKTKR